MNKIIYKTISKGGKPINEDVAYASENYWWILDGATGLTNKNLTKDKSDARWFVKKWDEYLKINLNNMNKTLKHILEEGIDKIKQDFYGEAEEDIKNIQRPSSTIALMRKLHNKIEYFLLGDCTVLIKDISGKVIKIKDTRIEKFDKCALEAMREKIEEEGLSAKKAREEINPILVNNRMLKNTYDGYWILEFEKEAIENGISGTIDINEIDSILIMSDGFAAIYDLYKCFDKDALFCNVEKKGLEYVYNMLREIEDEDYQCKKYLRFKKGDDASAVYMKFER